MAVCEYWVCCKGVWVVGKTSKVQHKCNYIISQIWQQRKQRWKPVLALEQPGEVSLLLICCCLKRHFSVQYDINHLKCKISKSTALNFANGYYLPFEYEKKDISGKKKFFEINSKPSLPVLSNPFSLRSKMWKCTCLVQEWTLHNLCE